MKTRTVFSFASALVALGCGSHASAPPTEEPAPASGGGVVFPGGGGPAPAGTGSTVSGAGGSSPGAGGSSPSAGGSAPSVSPTGNYDPSITFDWPESVQTAGSCKAGLYKGAFSGMYTSPATGGGYVQVEIPVTGNVELRLNESTNGEFFEIANGTVSGMANFTNPFSSGLEGKLNCTTGKLEGGLLTHGTYNVFGTDYFYEGPINADYDKLTQAFVNGKWQVGEPTFTTPPPPYGGSGDWSATYAGP